MTRRSKRRTAKVTESLSQTRLFAALLEQHIPAFVLARLRPSKEDLREGMKGLNPEQREALQAALRKITVDFAPEFTPWNEQFMACFHAPHQENMAEQVHRLPAPPPEPPDLWQRLLEQAHHAGIEGMAACLTLYYLGCARAVRHFQQRVT